MKASKWLQPSVQREGFKSIRKTLYQNYAEAAHYRRYSASGSGTGLWRDAKMLDLQHERVNHSAINRASGKAIDIQVACVSTVFYARVLVGAINNVCY